MFKTKGMEGGGPSAFCEKLQYWSGKASLFAQQDQVQKKQNVVWTDVPGETSTPLIISYIHV